MNTDKQEQHHLDRLLDLKPAGDFTISYVQNSCGIGYSNAWNVVERGIKSGKIEEGLDPNRFRIAV